MIKILVALLPDFTLAMLEMEVPFSKLGFDSFEEFLRNRIPDLNSLLKDPEIRKERFLVPVGME